MSVLCSPTFQISTDADQIGPWMHAQGAGVYRPGAVTIGLLRQGELVAATSYDYYNEASVVANIAIAGPITRHWLWAIFHYPFDYLRVRVLMGLVAEENEKSCHLTERFGFTRQTTIPDAAPSGALRLYTMTKAQCRFLEEQTYGRQRR